MKHSLIMSSNLRLINSIGSKENSPPQMTDDADVDVEDDVHSEPDDEISDTDLSSDLLLSLCLRILEFVALERFKLSAKRASDDKEIVDSGVDS